jgi:hypothetical protein
MVSMHVRPLPSLSPHSDSAGHPSSEFIPVRLPSSYRYDFRAHTCYCSPIQNVLCPVCSRSIYRPPSPCPLTPRPPPPAPRPASPGPSCMTELAYLYMRVSCFVLCCTQPDSVVHPAKAIFFCLTTQWASVGSGHPSFNPRFRVRTPLSSFFAARDFRLSVCTRVYFSMLCCCC